MECKECTLCCELFAVKWLDKPVNIQCQHCGLKKGCLIQDTKPSECYNFECAYSQMNKVHISFRPDNCKVIFEKLSDEVFFATFDFRYEITTLAKEQIENFVSQGFSVILFSNKIPALGIILAKGHRRENVITHYEEFVKAHGSPYL